MNIDPMDFHAPFSEEAERAVIGATLINPNAFANLSTFLEHQDFYFLRHNYIWHAMERLTERQEQLDYLTVSVELDNMNYLDDVGGQAYLTMLVQSVPTSVHAEVYGHLVERCAIRRKLLLAADEIKALAMDEELKLEQVLADTWSKLGVVQNAYQDNDLRIASDVMAEHEQAMNEAMLRESPPNSISTGLLDVDRLTDGFQPGELVIFAARAGMGKSAFAGHVALKASMTQGKRVLLFSLEMPASQYLQRLLAAYTAIPLKKLRPGNVHHTDAQMTNQEYDRYLQARDELRNISVTFDDTSSLNNLGLRLKAERAVAQGGIDLVIVDYIGLMKSARSYNTRREQLDDIIRSLSVLANDLKVPVLGLAQVNRTVTNREDKRPTLDTLKETGGYEEHANKVMFLHRDYYYDTSTLTPNAADIIVAKNRDGATGSASVFFDAETMRFMNAVRQDIELRG